jgi:TRAP-type uncharacterized transport system fused permease subunit
MLDSVSSYYYTSMRDVFVGLLVAVGVFLLFYRGVKAWDTILVAALGLVVISIALLPMDPTYSPVIRAAHPGVDTPACYANHGPLKFHDGVSAVFFALMSFIVIFRFPQTKELFITPQKQRRNLIYAICGATMALCVVRIVWQLKHDGSIFWPETVAIAAFGIAWLIKGQLVVRDDEAEREIPATPSNLWAWGKGTPRRLWRLIPQPRVAGPAV